LVTEKRFNNVNVTEKPLFGLRKNRHDMVNAADLQEGMVVGR
jgi:hypothetical protein